MAMNQTAQADPINPAKKKQPVSRRKPGCLSSFVYDKASNKRRMPPLPAPCRPFSHLERHGGEFGPERMLYIELRAPVQVFFTLL